MSSEKARRLRQQGIAAAKAGKKEEARKFLQASLKLEPDSEVSWLWMVTLARNKKERLLYLRSLLQVNPENETGLKAVRALGIDPQQLLATAQQAQSPKEEPPPPQPATETATDTAPTGDDDDVDIFASPYDDAPQQQQQATAFDEASLFDDDDDVDIFASPYDDAPQQQQATSFDDASLFDDDDDVDIYASPYDDAPQQQQATSFDEGGLFDDDDDVDIYASPYDDAPQQQQPTSFDLDSLFGDDDSPQTAATAEEDFDLFRQEAAAEDALDDYAEDTQAEDLSPEDALERAKREAEAIIQQVLVQEAAEPPIEWVHKEKRRAGEREVIVLRLQVFAGIVAFILVLGVIGYGIILSSPEAQVAVFGASPTPTFTPTLSPTPTIGITPTPSPTSDVTLTPSPTIDSFIEAGSEFQAPRPTEVYILPEAPSGVIRTAVAEINAHEPNAALNMVATERAANPLGIDPNPAYFEALALVERGDIDDAKEVIETAYERWQEEAPGRPYGPLLQLGRAEVELALAEKALAEGNTRAANEHFDLVEEYTTEVMAERPDFAQSYVLLARRYMLEEDYEEALKVLDQGLSLEELYADLNLRVLKSEIFFLQGEYDRAIQEAYETLYINPWSAEAHALRTRAALAKGEPGLAVVFAENFLNFYPGSVQAFKFRGDAFLMEGKTDLALENYTRALLGDQSDPAIVDVLLARADLYMQKRRYGLALEDYNLAYDLTGDDNVRVLRMQAAYFNGNYGIALNDADDLMGQDVVPDAELLLLQGRITADRARPRDSDAFREARTLINQAINRGLDPSLRPIADEYLARADYQLGNYEDALNAINSAIAAEETGTRHYLRGLILEALENFDSAIAEYEWVAAWGEVYPYPFRADVLRRLERLHDARNADDEET